MPPSRVLIAFDKFKGALSARQACDVAMRTLRRLHPDWRLDACPLTDGGEGFVRLLTGAAGGDLRSFPVDGPRGGLVSAPIGFVRWAKVPPRALALLFPEPASSAPAKRESLALIEMAAASGLHLLDDRLRDPWQASTRGTGQLIRAAAESGASAILLGIGGSATHDLGLGALDALGLEFRGAEGGRFRPPVPACWARLDRIEGHVFEGIPPIRIACDVENPLLGPQGAAAVYGPQKGLRPEDYDRLENQTSRLAAMLEAHGALPPSRAAGRPGAGAAGGLGFGLMVGAGARLLPGFALTAAWLDLEARVAAADAVVTGEGRFDASSLQGKAPGAMARQALALGKPVHVFAGRIESGPPRERGLHLHRVTPEGTPLAQALADASAHLAAAIERAFGENGTMGL